MELSAFIVSLVAVIIATASTVISYLIYRDARDPEVVVYATPDRRRPSIINLIIENSGRSSAWDIEFDPSAPIPEQAFGFENAKQPEPMSSGPIVNGIPCLGPGAQRVITWGQYGGLQKGIGDGYIDIETKYFSRPPLSIARRKHTTKSRLDVLSFENTDNSDHNWDKKVAEELKKIATTISGVRSSMEGAIRVMPVEEYDPEADA